jgi:hypothetical protein
MVLLPLVSYLASTKSRWRGGAFVPPAEQVLQEAPGK